MNGQVAQLVALTCHANSFLKHGSRPGKFFPNNSTCIYCNGIVFVETHKSWLGKSREKVVAADPDAWFQYLLDTKAHGVRIIWKAKDFQEVRDRLTAGLVGGGGRWMLEVLYPTGTDHWIPTWEVSDHDAPDQRIWRVTYCNADQSGKSAPAELDISDAKAGLESALERIHAFALDQGSSFADIFARALKGLRQNSVVHPYHNDLYEQGSISHTASAVLAAAEIADVFGGMGSWNDTSFDGHVQQEYDDASEQLFGALNNAICVAANESFK